MELIVSNSASAVKSSIFDLVVFNPPYLPSSSIDDKKTNELKPRYNIIIKQILIILFYVIVEVTIYEKIFK